MALIPYRANLSSAVFPMCLSKAGRTVIVPGADQNYDRRVDPAGEQKDAGIPQVIYLENVLPTPNGYQSVGFKPIQGGTVFAEYGITIPVGHTIRAVIEVNGLTNSYLLIFFSNDTVTSVPTGTNNYTSVTLPVGFTAPIATSTISYATVRGTVYIFFKVGGVGKLFTLANAGDQLFDVSGTVTALTLNNMTGICGAFNYLLFHDATTIYWSSTTSPVDFVPSLASGAGSEAIANSISIVRLLPHPTGFFVYSNQNVVAGKYTGNRSYPWKFREISDSGVFLSSADLNKRTTNSAIHVGINTFGNFQIISEDSAETVLPELTDYLERNIVYDVFDSNTNTFTQALDAEAVDFNGVKRMARNINYLADRYVIISYKATSDASEASFEYAIVYDYLLKRYGKLKINHTHVFEAEFFGSLIFVDSITGAVKIMFFDINDQNLNNANPLLRYQMNGVAVLGKLEFQRNAFITLEEVAIEASQSIALTTQGVKQFDLIVLPSLKGKQFDTPVVPTYNVAKSQTNLEVYNCHVTAKNISLLIKGAFDLNTIQIEASSGGDW